MRRLTSADDGAAVAAEPGEMIEIRLPQLGGTGYVWSVASSSNVVVVDDLVEFGDEPQPPGDVATRVLRVKHSSAEPGRLRLVRFRPWETADDGDAQFEITLTTTAD